MDEADVRRKIFRLTRELGYWPITQTDTTICPRCHAKVKPPIGRPDILCLHPSGVSIVIEVKVLRRDESSFPFARISDEQHRWLDRWAAAGGAGYIGLGVIRPAKSRSKLDKLYLVGWPSWLNAEDKVRPIQDSIPYVAGPGFARRLQDERLDITHLFAPWETGRELGYWPVPRQEEAHE